MSTLLATLAVYATVKIPDLTGQAVTAIQGDDSDALKSAALLIAAYGIARLVLSVARRLVAKREQHGRAHGRVARDGQLLPRRGYAPPRPMPRPRIA